jgi:hypothetical protein
MVVSRSKELGKIKGAHCRYHALDFVISRSIETCWKDKRAMRHIFLKKYLTL